MPAKTRSRATQGLAVLGEARPHTSTTLPITVRAIRAPGANGRLVEIGQLIHRDYESGHPERWEVHKHGGLAWGWYPDELAAVAGAHAYAAAFLRADRRDSCVDLNRLHGPASSAYEQAVTEVGPEVADALVAERWVVAQRLRKIVGEYPVDDVHGLVRALEEYAATLEAR